MALNDSFLQELKMKTDIEDIISTYVTLKRRGSTLVGLCPFHNEKTPSFTVYPDTQSFYCFGCGAGGDAIGFTKRIENLDYIDAVKLLAQRAGIQLPEEQSYDDSLSKKRRRILEMNRAAAKFFHSYMLSEQGKAGLNYYISRGLDKKTVTKFGLGYAPDSWDMLLKHLKEQGFAVSEMAEAGLIKKGNKGYYDMVRNRVMTPIIDIRGNVIAFGGRVLDDSKPKYINTSDTLVYKKTYELFGLNLAKDSGSDTLILCEGYMDVIAMHQAGFTNSIAGCGTALTNEQVKVISRYANEVILCYDNDDAGRKALNKAIDLFKKTDVKIRIPALSGGKDPDEIIRNHGVERFAAMLESSANDIEYAIINARSRHNINTTQGKVDFLNDVIKVLGDASPIEQDLYISRLAEELGVEKNSIKTQLRQFVRNKNYRQRKSALSYEISNSRRELQKRSYDTSVSPKLIKAQDRLIGLLIKYPKCAKLCKDFDENLLSEGFYRKVYSLTIAMIDNGYDTDLMNYSGDLSDSELGRLSGIIARFNDSSNYEQEFKDCLSVLSEDKAESEKKDISSLNDSDFNELFKRLADKNKNNT